LRANAGVYESLRDASTPCEARIARDVGRTCPDIEFFQQKDKRGQIMLTNVIRAYAVFDEEVSFVFLGVFVSNAKIIIKLNSKTLP
jgi:hypothetical protein